MITKIECWPVFKQDPREAHPSKATARHASKQINFGKI